MPAKRGRERRRELCRLRGSLLQHSSLRYKITLEDLCHISTVFAVSCGVEYIWQRHRVFFSTVLALPCLKDIAASTAGLFRDALAFIERIIGGFLFHQKPFGASHSAFTASSVPVT